MQTYIMRYPRIVAILAAAAMPTMASAQTGNDYFLQGLNAQSESFDRTLHDIDRCYDQDDQSACQRADNWSRATDRETARLGAEVQRGTIENGIRRDELRQEWNNESAHDREMARGYDDDARGSLQNGDPSAAAGSQERAQRLLEPSGRISSGRHPAMVR